MSYLITLAFFLLVYMTFWFAVSLIKSRNDVADIAWGLGFVLLAWLSLYISGNLEIKAMLVTFLVTVWGLRLSYHISKRHINSEEDHRYLKYRRSWGKWFFLRSYFQVYLLQGFFLFVIISPVLVINRFSADALFLLDAVGVIIWCIGFFFEAVGDAQLARFIKSSNSSGKLMMEGLWRYSRHPNYFGEVLQWWGIWIIALSLPYGPWTVIGPLTITFLILKVSGIPMLEEKMSEHPDFAEYRRRVSMFFPLPPRR